MKKQFLKISSIFMVVFVLFLSLIFNVPVKATGYMGTVTFVSSDGEVNVEYTDGSQLLNFEDVNGHRGDSGDKGDGTTKKYFLGWSTVNNYLGTKEQIESGAKAFYVNEPISNAFPEGLGSENKLYAIYLSATSAMYFSDKFKGDLTINRNIANEEVVYSRLDSKGVNDYYVSTDTDSFPIKLGASFTLNPFVNAVARYSPSHTWQPGTAEYCNNGCGDGTSTSSDVKVAKYTFVDLHIKLDDRISVSNNLQFVFKSYSFKPHMILTKDYTKIDNATISVVPNSPESTVSFDGSQYKEFIVRTRLRDMNDIPNATFEEANQPPMELVSLNENNFTISKEEIIKIARGEEQPLQIGGYIDGGAYLYGRSLFGFTLGGPTSIPKTESKIVALNYSFNKVSFNNNTASLGDNSEQNLSVVSVIHKQTIDTDSLDDMSMPAKPNNLKINDKEYVFKEWNTKADGKGEVFTGSFVVSEDLTVYAIWVEKNSSSNGNGNTPVIVPSLPDIPDFSVNNKVLPSTGVK